MKRISWNSTEDYILPKSFTPKSFNFSGNSITPGEWFISEKGNGDSFLCFGNLLANQERGLIWVLSKLDLSWDHISAPEKYISKILLNSIDYRRRIGLEMNCRLLYGAIDGLPGLIVDSYKNAILVQINSAGVDKYRDYVISELRRILKSTNIILQDDESQRQFESLPTFSVSQQHFKLEIEENNFQYLISSDSIQKNGYYYDHRNNRLKFENIIARSSINKTKMLDVFCYLGSWSMHGLRAGVEHSVLIDQGNLSEQIKSGMQLNGYRDRFDFIRSDAFKYLSNCNEKFSIIVADPPAFSKQSADKKNALLGYKKLVSGCLRLLAPESIFCLASCTHGVLIQDLERLVLDECKKTDRKCRLLEIGLNPPDHPINLIDSEQSYLKMLIYYII